MSSTAKRGIHAIESESSSSDDGPLLKKSSSNISVKNKSDEIEIVTFEEVFKLLTAKNTAIPQLKHILQSYLNNGSLPHVNMRNDDNKTLLMLLCEVGNKANVELLLDMGANMSLPNGCDSNALTIACKFGHFDIIQLILARITRKAYFMRYCGLALISACGDGNLEVAKLLLDFGTDVNFSGGDYGTALKAACCYGYIDVVKYLLSVGADIAATGDYDGSALAAAVFSGQHDVAEYLLDNSAIVSGTVDVYGVYSGSLFRYACDHGDYEMMRLLALHGADINGTDRYGDTPLTAACRAGLIETVRVLLELKVDIGASGRLSTTALIEACQRDNIELLQLLLTYAHLSDINRVTSKGHTALTVACRHNKLQAVQELLTHGALISIPGRHGLPFVIACQYCDVAVIELFLTAKADVNSVSVSYSRTALVAACLNTSDRYMQIVRLLIEKGIKMNGRAVDKFFGSALVAASVRGRMDAVELLLAKGANPGEHASYILINAARRGCLKLFKALLDLKLPTLTPAIVTFAYHGHTSEDQRELRAFLSTHLDTLPHAKMIHTSSLADLLAIEDADVAREALQDWHMRYDEGAIFTMVYVEGRLDFMRTLLEYWSRFPNVRTHLRQLCTLHLVEACISRNFAFAQLCLQYGIDANTADAHYRVPLIALLSGTPPLIKPKHDIPASPEREIVFLLLEYGADANLSTVHGSPMTAAAESGDVEMVELLIEYGGKVDEVDLNGGAAISQVTPFMRACSKGRLAVVKTLILYGADVHGNCPRALSFACFEGHVDVVRALLEYGVAVNKRLMITGRLWSTPASVAMWR